MVHTLATATNKAATLAALIRALQASGQLPPGTSSGVNQMRLFEIECAEPWALFQPAALSDQRGSFAYQADLESAQLMQFICPLMPKSTAAVGQEQLTVSTVAARPGVDKPPDPQPHHNAEQAQPTDGDSGRQRLPFTALMRLLILSCHLAHVHTRFHSW